MKTTHAPVSYYSNVSIVKHPAIRGDCDHGINLCLQIYNKSTDSTLQRDPQENHRSNELLAITYAREQIEMWTKIHLTSNYLQEIASWRFIGLYRKCQHSIILYQSFEYLERLSMSNWIFSSCYVVAQSSMFAPGSARRQRHLAAVRRTEAGSAVAVFGHREWIITHDFALQIVKLKFLGRLVFTYVHLIALEFWALKSLQKWAGNS